MHIPNSMLHGQVCPVTMAFGCITIAASVYGVRKSSQEVSTAKWAGVSALVFGLQMLNFPVTNGTSGHLLGGVLAASLLGVPRAILSLATVLVVQAFFFADGGVDALGANMTNMALIGVGFGGLLFHYLKKNNFSLHLSLAIASFLSVVLASLLCSVELAGSGHVPFFSAVQSMVGIHLFIGLGEAILTVLLFPVLSRVFDANQQNVVMARTALACLGVIALVPIASQLPDGLESAVNQLGISSLAGGPAIGLFADYRLPLQLDIRFSSMAAGLVGIILVWLSTFGLAQGSTLRVQR